MPENDPQPERRNLEEMLEGVIFGDPDPRVQKLKGDWHTAKWREQDEYEWECRMELLGRSLYHAILKSPDAEETARREANLCGILFMEDRDNKLAAIWAEVVAKVKAVLTKKPGGGA